MKKIMQILFILLALSLCGCGEGSTYPDYYRDLTGLEGTWIVRMDISGNLYGPYGAIEYVDSEDMIWYISRNSIRTSNGRYLTWNYYGTSLVVQYDDLIYDWTPTLGNISRSRCMTFYFNIQPWASFAYFSGSGNMSMNTQWRGYFEGSTVSSGYISKLYY